MRGEFRLVDDFTGLEVYCLARSVSKEIFELSKRLPPEENYSLRSQLWRSSRSIGAQIAEAWGKRAYPRHFKAKLTDADAEQRETRHWVRVALDCEYISSEEAGSILEQLDRIGRMLVTMMNKAHQFRVGKHQNS